MATYFEVKMQSGLDRLIDWNLELNRLIEDRLPYYHSIMALEYAANSWVTCACGNQCSIIPRDENGGPLDPTLKQLGYEFNHLIKGKAWVEAKKVLERIEIRSAQLLEEISK